jgi:hypothetical protein
MSDRNEKYKDKMKADLAGKTRGEVREIGVFSRPGSMAMTLAGAGTTWFTKGQAGGLPPNVIIAATDDEVYVWKYKPKGYGGVKVKEPIVVWPRASVRFSIAAQGALADTLNVEIEGQQPIQLDSNKMPGMKSDFNHAIVNFLAG